MHFQLDIFFGFVHHYYISVAGFLVDEKKKRTQFQSNAESNENSYVLFVQCACVAFGINQTKLKCSN